jgi:hypothetical protein
MKSPIELLDNLADDLARLNPDVKGLERDVITLKLRFEDEGYGFLAIALPALDLALLQGLDTGRFACPAGFKSIRGGTIPVLFSGMFCKIFNPKSGLLEKDIDLGVLKALHGVLLLFKKVRLGEKNEELLHSKAVDTFYQCDESASQVVIPDRHDHLIGRVASFLLQTLKTELKDESCKHGPGAVFEGHKANQKWEALWHEIDTSCESIPFWAGLEDFLVCSSSFDASVKDESRVDGLPKRGRTSTTSSRDGFRDIGLPQNVCSRPQLADSAKLISVLKNSTSRRTITIEPMLKQFTQQGLNTKLRASITRCRVLSGCIALTDQSLNQKLALEGSLYRNWATIDLKSASDLMSLKLVRSVFRHHPDFYQGMMDSRSPYATSPGKDKLLLGKFAGMGNATTFPVQSVTFATVAIAAILDSQGFAPSYWNVKRAARNIRVYGDDIIVAHRYSRQVVDWLHAVGLRVNVNKSFLVGNFRESCGVDAYDGVNITPLYIQHRPDLEICDDPSVIAHFVSLSNHMWMEGLYKASTWLKELVEDALGSVLPLVSRDSGSLGWHSRTDAFTPHKWCRNTHQFLTRTFVLAPLKRDDKLDGYAALLKCFHMPRKEYVEGQNLTRAMPDILVWEPDHLSKSVMRFKSRILRRWVPGRLALVS